MRSLSGTSWLFFISQKSICPSAAIERNIEVSAAGSLARKNLPFSVTSREGGTQTCSEGEGAQLRVVWLLGGRAVGLQALLGVVKGLE